MTIQHRAADCLLAISTQGLSVIDALRYLHDYCRESGADLDDLVEAMVAIDGAPPEQQVGPMPWDVVGLHHGEQGRTMALTPVEVVALDDELWGRR